MATKRLYIGIDAGGTRSRLRSSHAVETGGADLEGPGANPQRIGYEMAARILIGLVNEALADAPGARLAGLCIGIAGIGRDTDREQLSSALREALGAQAPARLTVISDADLALAAAYGASGSGLLVIAGTGSIVLGRTRGGEHVRAGGWGYLLGDEGGGYRIGLAGLQAAACSLDGGPATALTPLLRDSLGIDGPGQLIQTVYAPGWSPATVAPLVLAAADAGDAVCQAIVDEQTTALAGLIGRLVATTPNLDPMLRYTGGLTQHPGFAALLAEALRRVVPHLDIAPLATSPVEAALAIAQS